MKNIGGIPFECNKCGDCCKWEGHIYLKSDDVKKLSDFLHITINNFLSKYAKDVGGRMALKDKDENSECVFLKNNICEVHGVRPRQCDEYPVQYDKRCPGFRIKREGPMKPMYEDAVKQVAEKLSGTEDFNKAITNKLFEELKQGAKTASVASKAMEEGIDAFFNPGMTKVASLEDLFAFERVDKAHLIHKATHDLWSIQENNGDVNITRLFDDNGQPVKG